MTPKDIDSQVDHFRGHLAEVERRLGDPSIYSNQTEMKQVSREHRRLTSFFSIYDRWSDVVDRLDENRLLLERESDDEMRELVNADIVELEKDSARLEKEVQLALLPPDPDESRDIIVEIRPAAGGDESALFAGELHRLYARYAERRGWKLETLHLNGSDLGGVKEVSFSLGGEDVFSRMRYESGVHRVQRVPTTESGGRIHTSTVTVAVFAEAEEVEIEIKPEDLRIDVFRASGPGGQCVNTTDSAVRITHEPTGLSVASQQEKSQHRNKEIAMRILRARLLERQRREEAEKQAASKRAQIGTGERSERIRTYNFPQNRVTDHRFNVSIHDLPTLMDGELDLLLEPIIAVDQERRLQEALSLG